MEKETGQGLRKKKIYFTRVIIHVHFNLKQNQKNTSFPALGRNYNIHKHKSNAKGKHST